MVALLQALRNGANYRDLPGLVYRENGRVIMNRPLRIHLMAHWASWTGPSRTPRITCRPGACSTSKRSGVAPFAAAIAPTR